MGSPSQKKVRIIEQDRLSSLPDELIHKIHSFLDTKVAVQMSVLSKRWKLIWTTLPFLNFGEYQESSRICKQRFLCHVLSNRNHQSYVSELSLCSSMYAIVPELSLCSSMYALVEMFIGYAILHNVMYLNLDLTYYRRAYKLSTLSSQLLKKLTLRVILEEFASESDCWDLPALTYLHLVAPRISAWDSDLYHKLPDSCLTCLPALTTLCLDFWNLSQSSFSFSLPHLTTLCMSQCSELPKIVWNFPSLLSLELDDVDFPVNMSDVFPTLVNLKNLTLFLTRSSMEQHHSISCPQLLNLSIKIRCSDSRYGEIKVLAPKLCNFTSFGILSITFEVPVLENVKIKLHDWFGDMDWIYRKRYYPMFIDMLSGLGNAKNLTFDLDSMKAFSVIPDLASLPSPFYKLKYVKLPQGCSESSIYSALRSYLLGSSQRGTIGTTVSQSNMIPQTVAVSMTSQYAVLQGPLAAPTKELDDSQYIHQTPNVGTVNLDVQEEHVVEDSVVDAGRFRHIDSPGEEIGKDQVSSATGNRDFGLWRGHEVNSEFVCLLDRIMHKYPETFEHFTTKNKRLCTMNLNMLCTSLNDFTKISMTEVDSEMILEYKDVFSYLQNRGFNVSWAVCRLNYIEHLWFSQPLIPELHAIDCRIHDEKNKLQELQAHLRDLQAHVDDAQAKLQDMQTLRAEKLTEIEKAFGTIGTNLAVGFIGGDLLSSP